MVQLSAGPRGHFRVCSSCILIFCILCPKLRHAVTELIEALCYKLEGCGFDFRWGHWDFFHLLNPSGRTMVLGSTPTVTENFTRGISCESKGNRCVRLTILPPACDDFIEIMGILESSWSVQVLQRSVYLYTHNGYYDTWNIVFVWPFLSIQQCPLIMAQEGLHTAASTLTAIISGEEWS